jgi:hypothetical protein
MSEESVVLKKKANLLNIKDAVVSSPARAGACAGDLDALAQPAAEDHRKSPVARAFSVAGL